MSTQRKREAALAADPTLRPHGDVGTYTNWGCRCERCTAAKRAAYRAWWAGLGGSRRKARRRAHG